MDTPRESDTGTAQHSQHSDALYQQIFENAPYGFFVAHADTTGGIQFPLINDNAAKLLEAEMYCEHPDYATGLKSAIRVIAVQRHEGNLATRLEREDKLLLNGREQHIKTTLTPIYDESGGLSSVIGVIDDISFQKSREYLQTLRESEFRSIAERIGTGIVRFDTDCRRIYANPYVAQAYGIPLSDILGKNPSELPGGTSGDQYETLIREVFRTGRYVEYNHEVKSNGRSSLCRIMLFPEWLATGEVGSVLAIGQSLESSREKLKLLQEGRAFDTHRSQPSNVVLCFNRNGECNYINEAADDLLQEFGQTAAALSAPGQTAKHPFVAEIRAAVRQVLDTGEPLEKELAWSAANGHPYHLRVRYQPKRSIQGTIISVFAIASKLESTENWKGVHTHNAAAQQEAAREDERRRIALEIHDELGQLLTALRFRVAMLRPQFEAGNRLVEKGMQEIIDIIDRGSREVRRITTNARPIQLGQGLRAALADLIGDFSSHTGIDFELDLEDRELPLDDASATAVFRIVQESITNIARHSGAQKAWLSLTRKLDQYHLKIADNGSGFDLSAQRKKSLGLIGIRERVLLLNGELHIQSAPGQGTSIQISVPARPA